MAEYRRHASRWHVIKWSAAIALMLVLAGFNAFRVFRGLVTGSVESLRRRSDELVYAAMEPGWFGFNICVRTAAAILFAGVALLVWKKLQAERRH